MEDKGQTQEDATDRMPPAGLLDEQMPVRNPSAGSWEVAKTEFLFFVCCFTKVFATPFLKSSFIDS
jgi:hypothetical protein